MFKSLLRLGRRPNTVIVDALYEQIVAAARQSAFYSGLGVPDMPLGRYEMLSLHMFLFLERARPDRKLADVAQDLTDEFFKDVEHSIRELGISDVGVPKRMKKLARMFYGRAEAYRAAIETGDRKAMAAAVSRNVWPDGAAGSADDVAAYAFEAARHLGVLATDDILAGTLSFPAPAVRG